MSTLSGLFTNAVVPTSLDKLGALGVLEFSSASLIGAASVDSGSTTAGVLKTVVNKTGPGVLEFLSIKPLSITYDLRVKITMDGVVVLDKTTAISALTHRMLVGNIVGQNASGVASALSSVQLLYNQSLLIECSTSTTVTDAFRTFYRAIDL